MLRDTKVKPSSQYEKVVLYVEPVGILNNRECDIYKWVRRKLSPSVLRRSQFRALESVPLINTSLLGITQRVYEIEEEEEEEEEFVPPGAKHLKGN